LVGSGGEVVEAWIASGEHCAGSLRRLQFSVDQFGRLPITGVVPAAAPVAIRIGGWTLEHGNFTALAQKPLDFILDSVA
tara:strand:+ start:3488 stop:3724 length:237 start_codon:yes stop_codon:yes gene_type:complete